MEKIRKGNDIEVLWAIYAGTGVNEAPYDLTGRNLTLYVTSPYGKERVGEFETSRHLLKWVFHGKDQKYTGKYTLTLIENEGRTNMHTVDECDAFELVKCSCEADHDPEGRVECIHLQFKATMAVNFPTIGGGIAVDSLLSLDSENPVQNKVITKVVYELKEQVESLDLSKYELRLEAVENVLTPSDGGMTLLDRVTVNEEAVKAVEDRMTVAEETINTLTGTGEGSVTNMINSSQKWVEL